MANNVKGDKKRIVIIGQYIDEGIESGNSRFEYLAKMLSNTFEIYLLTSSFYHFGKRQKGSMPNIEGYHLDFIYEPGYRRNVGIGRILSHKVFGRNLFKKIKSLEKIDLIYCAIPSIDAAWKAMKYARGKDVPFILDIQDLWPEAFQMIIHNKAFSQILFAPMKRKVNYIYEQSNHIVSVSETYLNRANEQRTSKGGTIAYLGTDKKTFDKFMAENPPNKPFGEFWLTYVGTLGHSYDIKLIIEAMSFLKEKKYENIVFHVIGDGPLKQQFVDYAKGTGIKVVFHGKLSYPKAVGYLGVSDIAVNPIVPKSPASIINKHGDYAMAGLPVVSTQLSKEYIDLLKTYRAGITCYGRDPKLVAEAIEGYYNNKNLLEEHGRNSRLMGEELFDRERTYTGIMKAIEDIVGD